MNIEPIKFDANLIYLCDKCQEEHTIQIAEARIPEFKILCYCGNVIRPRCVYTATLKIKWAPEQKQHFALSYNQQRAVKILKKQGYKNADFLVRQIEEDTIANIIKKAVMKHHEEATKIS